MPRILVTFAIGTAIAVSACGGGNNDPATATGKALTSTVSTNSPTQPSTSTSQQTATVDDSATVVPSATSTNAPTATPTATLVPPTPTPIPTVDNTPPLVIVSKSGGPRGQPASVTIHTEPGIECSIGIVLPDGTPTPVAGLDPQTSDGAGQITWTWTIDPSWPTGQLQAQVSCQRSRRAALIEIS
jgi:hypothetical protein